MADRAAGPDGPVEGAPRRKMLTRSVVGIGEKLVEALPIFLNENDPAGNVGAVP